MRDTDDAFDVVDPEGRCPLHGGRGSRVLGVAGAKLLDDGVRNQNAWREALDQVDVADPGQQNQR